MCLSKMSMRRIGAKIKAGVMMGAIVLALSPMNVFADSSTVQGNGGTISGYTVTTSSTAITNPTYFTASTYIRSSRKASEGALRAKSQMRVGIYSPYDFTIISKALRLVDSEVSSLYIFSSSLPIIQSTNGANFSAMTSS